MARLRSLALLSQILETNAATFEDIDGLIITDQSEGLYLNFKSGLITGNRDAPNDLRRHVSAFANSEGGVLVLGVREAEKLPSGKPGSRNYELCPESIGGQSVKEWARSCISPIAGFFTEQPRYIEIAHQNGKLLIIGVPRNGSLIPVSEDGRQVWYLRHEDESIRAADYLIADLQLGRRRSPRLIVKPVHFDAEATSRTETNGYKWFQSKINLSIQIDNDSPSWIEDLRCGIIHFTKAPETGLLISDHVRTLIDVRPSSDKFMLFRAEMRPKSSAGQKIALGPFESVLVGPLIKPIAFPPGETKYRVASAIYVAGSGSDVVWYQLEARITTWILGDRPTFEAQPFARVPAGLQPLVCCEAIS